MAKMVIFFQKHQIYQYLYFKIAKSGNSFFERMFVNFFFMSGLYVHRMFRNLLNFLWYWVFGIFGILFLAILNRIILQTAAMQYA